LKEEDCPFWKMSCTMKNCPKVRPQPAGNGRGGMGLQALPGLSGIFGEDTNVNGWLPDWTQTCSRTSEELQPLTRKAKYVLLASTEVELRYGRQPPPPVDPVG